MLALELLYTGNIDDDFQLQDRYKEISRMLQNHICEVTFRKTDNSIRIMPCTLQESVLPPRDPSKLSEAKLPSYSTLSVWCTDKNQWRSFRIANVTRIKVIND